MGNCDSKRSFGDQVMYFFGAPAPPSQAAAAKLELEAHLVALDTVIRQAKAREQQRLARAQQTVPERVAT